MSKQPKIKDIDLVLAEAEWMARLQEGSLGKEMSDGEKEAFQAWLTENPDNATKLDDCFDAWALSKDLESSPEIMALLGEDVSENLQQDIVNENSEPKKKPRWLNGAIAACFAIVAVAFTLNQNNFNSNNMTQYHTGIGEQTVYTLTDGSRVQMNTDTYLTLNFTDDRRELYLLRGEAAFDVVHDPDRPFDVLSGKGRARAIGTRFNVFKDGEKVTVSVIEGVVQVASSIALEDTANVVSPNLSIGQQMSYSEQGDMSAVKSFDIQKIQAWQKGRLEFFNASLGEVVQEMNRYSPMSIMVGDDNLLLLKVSGIFDVKEPGKMLEGLEDILPIRVLENNNKLVISKAEIN